MEFRGRKITFVIVALCILSPILGKGQQMSLNETIQIAKTQSVAALEARNEFISSYWQYRSYRASMLPSVNLYGSLMSFDRSLTLLQDYTTGEMRYTKSYNLQNSLGFSISQNIPFTGGAISVYSDLSRIDQFGTTKGITWYSQPFTIRYTQSLFSYNQFKWDKKISPKEYELSKRKYIESMEQITIEVVEYFYALLLAKNSYQVALSNYNNTLQLRSIANERMKLGRVSKDELLKLDLNLLKDSININESAVKIREAQMQLNSLLGYDESLDVNPIIAEELPIIEMDYQFVIDKSLANSSFSVMNEIGLLNAESDVARAKASRGISMSLMARLGLSKTDSKLREVYKSPLDQEIVGLSFSIPIFDWGLGYGRVQKAKAAQEASRAKVQQSENDYRRKIFMAVGQFNNQRQQCLASKKAQSLAQERYDLMVEKFRGGKATVTELIDSQSEKDMAIQRYITDISNFWRYYYGLRQLTLYDFIEKSDIIVDFNQLIY